MTDERWRRVPESRLLGIPAGYQASSEARVLGVRGTVLAQREDRDGYLTVKVGGRPVRVHVLVQLAFAGPPEVRHLDGDRGNNRPGNLEWGSRWRNERDKRDKRDGRDGRGVTVPSLPVTPVTGGAG